MQKLQWTVGCTADPGKLPEEMLPARVPGAAQKDYADAKGWDSVYYGNNFKKYHGLEDLYWLYQAELCFALAPGQTAFLYFKGIDYQYRISVDGDVLCEGEGMFTPIECDVTGYAGGKHLVQVLVYPAPKATDEKVTPGTRDEAHCCCKPAACYGWDWHPRLISTGIWDEAGLVIRNQAHIKALDATYTLSEALDSCRIHVQVRSSEECRVVTQLLDGEQVVAQGSGTDCVLSVQAPKLWYPVGYGEQPLYTLQTQILDETGRVLDTKQRRLGLRRARMVMNEGSWRAPRNFPKSRSDAPATLEINGIRIFAKGSNWVNMELFPGESTREGYATLLKLVKDANMNILRIWGGGYVNHEAFFELCDEMGIMVWQEFPLACNEYPDEDHYLSVLEQEATSIVRRLRTHPCVVMWCGGNELFNNWSKMTDQHHALRLLDKVCYTEDRFTPFIMTSPLNGMAHGSYYCYETRVGKENITVFTEAANTTYTEFGCSGAADPEYIKKYLDPRDYDKCGPDSEVWVSHFAFKAAHYPDTWLRTSEAEYYFGGYTDVDDLCRKTQFLQSMVYKAFFEEHRKQWPHCSMSLNWCFNEPWPCFANASLVSWPALPKPCYYAVQQALRPRLASLRTQKHLWTEGEEFNAQVWVLNDSIEPLEPVAIKVSYQVGNGEKVFWGSLQTKDLPEQTNVKCGSISFDLASREHCTLQVWLEVENHPEMDSHYTYLCRPKVVVNTKGMLNV